METMQTCRTDLQHDVYLIPEFGPDGPALPMRSNPLPMNTTQTAQEIARQISGQTCEFVLATDLKVGMVTSLGPIASIDKITKTRVYYTINLRRGVPFQDWTAKSGRCAIIA
jgi:hypothetical protein